MTSAPKVRIAGIDEEFPLTLSTDEAAGFLGCCVDRLYQERGNGTLPVEPLKLGKRLRWPTLKVAESLGLAVELVY